MKRNVIAISGWRGSGKDTAADFLVGEFGYTKLSFAKPLKDLVAETYGIDRAMLDSASGKETPLQQYPVIPTDAFTATVQERLTSELSSGYWTPRALCILEGSMKRAVHANHWVRRVAGIITGIPDMNFVISDLRYQSEADTLKLLVPEIKLLSLDRFDSIDTVEASERDLDNYRFDYRITNRKSVEELYNQLCNIPEITLDDING
jgi:hypothetical protein